MLLSNNSHAQTLRSLGYQGHHIIPKEILDEKGKNADDITFINARNFLQEAGFDIQSFRYNGIFLPDGRVGTIGHENRSVHRGGHAPYTKKIAEGLSDLYKDIQGLGLSQPQKLQVVNKLVSKTKGRLRSGELRLNKAVDHTKGAREAVRYERDQYANGHDPITAENGGVDFKKTIITNLNDRDEYELYIKTHKDSVNVVREDELKQYIDEISQALNEKGLVPSFNLKQGAKGTHTMMAMNTMHDTLVGDVLERADCLLKDWVSCATSFPKEKTESGLKLLEYFKKNKIDINQLSSKELLDFYVNNGAVNHLKDGIYENKLKEFDRHCDAYEDSFETGKSQVKDGIGGWYIEGNVNKVYQDNGGRVIFHADKSVKRHDQAIIKGKEQKYTHSSEDSNLVANPMKYLKDHIESDRANKILFDKVRIIQSIFTFITSLRSHHKLPFADNYKYQQVDTRRIMPNVLCQKLHHTESNRSAHVTTGGAMLNISGIEAENISNNESIEGSYVRVRIAAIRLDEEVLSGIQETFKRMKQSVGSEVGNETVSTNYSETAQECFVDNVLLQVFSNSRQIHGNITTAHLDEAIKKSRYQSAVSILKQYPNWVNHLVGGKDAIISDAIWSNNEELFDICINNKKANLQLISKTNESHPYPLQYAIEFERLNMIERMINDKRIDLNQKNQFGDRPIKLAVDKGNVEVIRMLLSKNPSLDFYIQDKPLLQYAIENAEDRITLELLNHPNVDIDQQDSNGWTALHYAVFYKNNDMAQRILDKSPDLLLSDQYGNNPLHYCMQNDKKGVGSDIFDYILKKCNKRSVEQALSEKNSKKVSPMDDLSDFGSKYLIGELIDFQYTFPSFVINKAISYTNDTDVQNNLRQLIKDNGEYKISTESIRTYWDDAVKENDEDSIKSILLNSHNIETVEKWVRKNNDRTGARMLNHMKVKYSINSIKGVLIKADSGPVQGGQCNHPKCYHLNLKPSVSKKEYQKTVTNTFKTHQQNIESPNRIIPLQILPQIKDQPNQHTEKSQENIPEKIIENKVNIKEFNETQQNKKSKKESKCCSIF